MSDFITLSCPKCGGGLQITKDIDRFTCAYCGQEQIVRRGAGTITLEPVAENIKAIREVTGRTASELAIVRIKGEISEVREQIKTFKGRTNVMPDASIVSLEEELVAWGNNKSIYKPNKMKSFFGASIVLLFLGLNAHLVGMIVIGLIATIITGKLLFSSSKKKKILPEWKARIDERVKGIESLKEFEVVLNKKVNQLKKHQQVVDE